MLNDYSCSYIVPSSDHLWPQVGQPRLFCGEHLTISFRTLKQKWLETVTCRLPVRKKTSCGWQMLKKCVKIFACKHHANDTSRHPCAFETKPRNTGNADGAGRASSALALADAVVTDVVLVDDFVVDLVLLILVDVFVDDIDTVLDVVLVDTLVVDRVLVLVDTVLDVVLVDAVVDDFVLVMLVDAVVDVVQLEVGVLDRTQQVMLLLEGFCT